MLRPSIQRKSKMPHAFFRIWQNSRWTDLLNDVFLRLEQLTDPDEMLVYDQSSGARFADRRDCDNARSTILAFYKKYFGSKWVSTRIAEIDGYPVLWVYRGPKYGTKPETEAGQEMIDRGGLPA